MDDWVGLGSRINFIVLKLVNLLCIVLFVISVTYTRFQTSEEFRFDHLIQKSLISK